MTETILFSTITVSYNSEKTISRTIESLLKQSINNIEYIIIDGNSTDKTVEVIKSFEHVFSKKKIKYTWISERDQGIYDAFNKGLKLASGKWISFLGSDDYYLPNALNTYNKHLSKLKQDVDFIHSIVNVDDKKVISDAWSWSKFKRSMNIAHVGAFHNKDYFMKYGFFNTNYKIAGDYELLLRAKDKLKTYYFQEVTAFMSDEGVSNKQVEKVYEETTQIKIDIGSTSWLVAKFDYYLWIFKYKVKKMINAIV
jgi:glycosyltransferase involved in cell wall biosynthesis